MTGNLLFGMFPTFFFHLHFFMSLFVLSGSIPSSALNAVSLVVLDNLGIYRAAVFCTVSDRFTKLAFLWITHLYNWAFVRSHSPRYISWSEGQGANLFEWYPSCLRAIYRFLFRLLYMSPKSCPSIYISTLNYVCWSKADSSPSLDLELKITGSTLSWPRTTTAHLFTFAVTLHLLVYYRASPICVCNLSGVSGIPTKSS